MITHKNGNILNAKETIIAHQVNCIGFAGGLAGDIFYKYPVAEDDYLQICSRLSENALGMCQLTGSQYDGHIIANLFGQKYPGKDTRPEALRQALHMLSEAAQALKCDVALPWHIGCGIGGGDWDEILAMIEEEMKDVNVSIYRRGDRG